MSYSSEWGTGEEFCLFVSFFFLITFLKLKVLKKSFNATNFFYHIDMMFFITKPSIVQVVRHISLTIKSWAQTPTSTHIVSKKKKNETRRSWVRIFTFWHVTKIEVLYSFILLLLLLFNSHVFTLPQSMKRQKKAFIIIIIYLVLDWLPFNIYLFTPF